MAELRCFECLCKWLLWFIKQFKVTFRWIGSLLTANLNPLFLLLSPVLWFIKSFEHWLHVRRWEKSNEARRSSRKFGKGEIGKGENSVLAAKPEAQSPFISLIVQQPCKVDRLACYFFLPFFPVFTEKETNLRECERLRSFRITQVVNGRLIFKWRFFNSRTILFCSIRTVKEHMQD